MILLDTNILFYAKDGAHPENARVTQQITQWIAGGETLVVNPQVLYEFYVVATRTSRGLGLSSQQARQEVQNIKDSFHFVNDPYGLFDKWDEFIDHYQTLGKSAHDTRIVAFMDLHNINRIYTDNVNDFNRYSDRITILN